MQTEQTISKPEMLSISQIAKRGILPERALRHLVAVGKIPYVTIGKKKLLNYGLLCQQLNSGEGELWR